MPLLTKFKNSFFVLIFLRLYGAIVSLPFALITTRKVKPPKNVYHCEWIRFLSKKYNFENLHGEKFKQPSSGSNRKFSNPFDRRKCRCNVQGIERIDT